MQAKAICMWENINFKATWWTQPERLKCKWSIGVTTAFSKGIFVLTSEDREIILKCCQWKNCHFWFKLILSHLQDLGKGIDPFLYSPPCFILQCAKLTNNTTNYLETHVPFSAIGNLQFCFRLLFFLTRWIWCVGLLPVGLSLLIFLNKWYDLRTVKAF